MIPIENKSPEWYTPKHILELIYRIMEIDLDPASPEEPTVNARKYYTKKENGLLQSWHGNIYLNPPYGREILPWIKKTVDEYEAGNIQNIILLLPAKTDTFWFNHLVSRCACFCTIQKRLHFISGDNPNTKQTGTFPSVLVLLSKDKEIISRFILNSKELGYCWQLTGDN